MVKKEEIEEPTRDKKKAEIQMFKNKEDSGEWTMIRKDVDKNEYELTINFGNIKLW